ncbi:MAG: hypothetical protein A3G25_05160 [Betaproteobacteria bacterium RIFCSPLOWO2_12_FULL_63_13]|nr:MAG: hypothetical protein A3H32_02015 [Betaproteobacteria bacterium RIFCSPLOWO2_02_FULL_63_19]OGA53919.1 MAG: hypothetical protein A3G25_05160 [Betaproteobacteria bacterium RIFCSPLOWO2_12_FULL_63_13]
MAESGSAPVETRHRHDGRAWLERLLSALSVCATLACIVYVVNVPTYFDHPIFREQFFGLIYGLLFASGFLLFPAERGSRQRVPWYDLVLAAAGFAAGLNVTVMWPELVASPGVITPERVFFGVLAVLVVLELTRRAFGLPLVILVALFIFYARFSYLFPGILQGRGSTWSRVATFLYLDTGSMLGMVAMVMFGTVFAFMLFGAALFATGGGSFFTDLSLALMGGRRGGPAKVGVLGSALFGTLSGSASSNVVITGSITIPMMKRLGYRPAVAAAVEAVASTGGSLMPPVMGATAFVMAEFLSVPYREVALAALVPAILYYLMLFIFVDLEAGKQGLKGLPADQIPKLGAVLAGGWPYLAPLAVLIACLFYFYISPDLSALLGTLAVLALGLASAQRPSWRDLGEALTGTGRMMVEVGVIGAAAGLIIGSINLTGLGLLFSQILISASGGHLGLLLLLTALASAVLGMGMPVTASYIILAVLAAPALIEAGVSPMAAHMFILYFAMLSFLTPPVCVAVYIAATIAGSRPMETAFESMKMGLVAYLVPFLFVADDALLLAGTSLENVVAAVTGMLGFGVLAVAIQGYFTGPLGVGVRIVLAVAALFLVTHEWVYNAVGLAIAGAVLAWLWRGPSRVR